MSDTQGTLLDGIPGWTRELIERLNEGWITTAEQVVELAATPDGMAALTEHLSGDPAMAGPVARGCRLRKARRRRSRSLHAPDKTGPQPRCAPAARR